ncbi:adenylate kinase [Candidatus Dependentiae bacterium]
MKRIVIVGSIGAGKSSLAKVLSKKLHIEHIELDNLFWLPEWNIRPAEEVKELAAKKIDKPAWIICGNFSFLRPLIWPKADTVVWLDYPFLLCFWRTLKRSFINIIKRRKCCNGNQETFGRLFFSKNSILLWCIRTYKRRNKRYERLMHDPVYKHIRFVRLKSDKETNHWVNYEI